MTPETGTALIILAAFVLPGFVTIALMERTYAVAVRDRSSLELLLLALYYSAISYAVVGLATWPFGLSVADVSDALQEGRISTIASAGVVIVFLLPALIATAARLWSGWSRRDRWLAKVGIKSVHSVGTGWDFFFRQLRPVFVVASLRDGAMVAGYYGPKSFATYSADGHDLFLEERWTLDDNGWFGAPAGGGLWVSGADVVRLAVYDAEYEPENPAVPPEQASASVVDA